MLINPQLFYTMTILIRIIHTWNATGIKLQFELVWELITTWNAGSNYYSILGIVREKVSELLTARRQSDC